MQQTVTVRAIITKGNQVLLLHRKHADSPEGHGIYELPGGKLASGEDAKASIARLISQELAVEPSVVQLQDVITYQNAAQPDIQHVITVFAVGLPQDASIRLSDEHSKFVWQELKNIPQEELSETTKAALKLAPESMPPELPASSVARQDDKSTTDRLVTHDVIVYSDGGSRGNPGPSAAGFVIFDDNNELVFEGGKYLGITTNNQAEYQAVKLGLEKALELGARVVQFRMDSLLVANQMNGIYKIKNRDLWPIHAAIKELVGEFKKVTFSHVYREYNKDADAMVNKILDAHKGSGVG